MYKLSIIIPIYNAEKYLQKCLETVIKNINDVEYILIDDGSTDKSNLIYEKYSNNSNVVIVKNENHGVSYTRNHGINIANGKYIMFVDSDDYLEDNWFEIIEKDINNDLDMVIFSKYYNNYTYNKLDLQKACLNCGDNELKRCSIMSPVSRIFNKKFLNEKNIKFNTDIINGEDMLFNFQAISQTNKIKIVNKSFYIYRLNFDSATNNFNQNIFKSDITFHLRLKELARNDENYSELKESIEYLIINGIYIMLVRLSFSKEKNKEKIIKEIIEKDLYKKALKNYYNLKSNFSKFERLILNFVSKEHVKLAITMFNLKNRIKKIIHFKKETIRFKNI